MPARFTYSGDPANKPRDAVRFWAGDTIKDRAMFNDGEVDFVLSLHPNTKIAAAELLEVKAREFARQADVRVGDVSKAFSKVSEAMLKAAKDLRRNARRLALPFFGGLTVSGKRNLALQTDDVQPQFRVGQNDNPEAVQLEAHITNILDLTRIP